MPQQLIHAQYADVLNVFTTGSIPATFLANVVEASFAGFVVAVLVVLFLVVTCFVLTSIILFTGFFITFEDISIFSISLSF